jgi:glycosyltransferase involved in cell wall biosynthesis
MITGQCIVCMPLTSWDNKFTNTIVKLMTLLSKRNRVLFVNYQYTLKDIISSLRGKEDIPVKRIFGLQERLIKVKTSLDSEIYVLTCPPVFPINWIKNEITYEYMLKANAGIVKNSIHKAIGKLEMTNIILINGYNSFIGLPLIREFNELLSIYYCYDEIRGDHRYNYHGPKVEEEYMCKTDLVITTSDALYSSKKHVNQNCFVVKNGVDFEIFNHIADFKRQNSLVKTVGYTGSIDERFDIDTASYVIKNLLSVKFEFVGRIVNDKARRKLEMFPNVTLYGSRRQEEVPYFLKNMDVCIIPYLKTEGTKGVYPLKINEYLAAGKPVVMTDFAPLPEFTSVVRIASSKEKFLEYLKEEIDLGSESLKQQRIEIARKNSWENRVEELSDVIENFLKEKRRLSA